jgi:hypothetical protein
VFTAVAEEESVLKHVELLVARAERMVQAGRQLEADVQTAGGSNEAGHNRG